MVKAVMHGCNGHMGRVITDLCKDDKDIKIVAGVDKYTGVANDYPVFESIEKVDVDFDVIIDFSIPEATLNILEFAKNNKIPTVIATTGFTDDQINLLNEYSEIFPIFRSANMSYEVNLMAKIVSEVAKKLTDSDIEIIETHHHRKIDSPSGTALLLADSINDALNNEMYYEYDRHSKREKRNPKEIGIHSIRGGTEVGTHSVIFFGNNEKLEITHSVTSRSVFATGAVKAAFYIFGKEKGLFSMNDLV